MNFDFSDDQRLLQHEVHRMLAATSTSAEVRQTLEGHTLYSKASWQALLQMGAATAAIPRCYVGAGFGYLELCLVAEEAGRHLAAVPLATSVYLGAEALLRGGSEEQKQRWLPRIASGGCIATAQFRGSESNLKPTPARFEGGKLSGDFVLAHGLVANKAVLRVNSCVVLVDLSAEVVTRKALPSMDPSRPYAEIHLDATPADLMVCGQTALSLTAVVHNSAAILIAFE